MLLSKPQPQNWESALLERAYEAFQPVSSLPQALPAALDLKNAYRQCSQLTAAHSRSFYLACLFLPGSKRRAMHALYAFCRVADDLVDHPNQDAQASLAAWGRKALSGSLDRRNPVILAWSDARQKYRIPARLAEQLLDGVGRDLHPASYQTFAELAEYAYGVASTVGLMSMHITGFSTPQAVPYAVRLGVALQLTNILRDVGEDWRAGRVYLPLEELAAFGLDKEDLARGQVDDRWRSFMRFQIARNRRLYAEALPGIELLHPDGRLAVAAAAEFYGAILEDIEAHDYDVFSRRAHLSVWQKLLRLPALWHRRLPALWHRRLPALWNRKMQYKESTISSVAPASKGKNSAWKRTAQHGSI